MKYQFPAGTRRALLFCDLIAFLGASLFGMLAAWYLLVVKIDALRLFAGVVWGIGMALRMVADPFFPKAISLGAWLALLLAFGKYRIPASRVRLALCPATAVLVLAGAYTFVFLVMKS